MNLSRRWTAPAVLVAAVLLLCTLAVARVTGVFAVPHETGWLSPVFAPDGQSIYAVRRDVRALITGFGYASLTPPATVRLYRDRIDLVNIRLSDGRVTVVNTFPPTPLEGTKMETYHGAVYGEARAHLRWADSGHLDYEIAVVRPEVPASRSYVTRRVWNPKTNTTETTGPWAAGSTGMGGLEAQRLAGDLEVMDAGGDEGMGCAIVVLRAGAAAGRALVGSSRCRSKFAGYTAAALAPYSHRGEIERSELIRKTYADLVSTATRRGVPEGQAMLDANDEMSRLGLYPKQPMLTARRADCGSAPETFDVSDEELTIGLFPDIERAIAAPGRPVHPSAPYITHRDYTTSQRLNAYLDAGHSEFFVRARAACWQLELEK